MNWDRLRLPQRFTSIIDGKEPAMSYCVCPAGGAIGLWSVEVLFDGEG
jgi:hypothetical protein